MFVEAPEKSGEDLLASDLPVGCRVVRWRSCVGRNSIVVTKKVQDSQTDSKWQSISTGRAQ
ncbi:hypothetical protein [Streptomyces sp. NPDC048277]|uniref:hypothetical protein n=1 Tax=Streptomyces sp. NPDC048277 TaxID=3155027 RepID=UPI0033C19733